MKNPTKNVITAMPANDIGLDIITSDVNSKMDSTIEMNFPCFLFSTNFRFAFIIRYTPKHNKPIPDNKKMISRDKFIHPQPVTIESTPTTTGGQSLNPESPFSSGSSRQWYCTPRKGTQVSPTREPVCFYALPMTSSQTLNRCQ